MLFFCFFDTINNRGGGILISHTNRKDFFYIIVLILTFITFVVGMAFAIYSWIYSQKEGTSAVYTGTLSIEYLSSNIINVDSLYPIKKPSYDANRYVYRNNFRVTNTGSLDGIVRVLIDVTKNEFSNNVLMYSLYNSNKEELTSGFLNGADDIIIMDNLIMESNITENFVLIVWLNESEEDQNTEMQKTFVGTIEVDASQKKE